jgi:hypothetical protein
VCSDEVCGLSTQTSGLIECGSCPVVVCSVCLSTRMWGFLIHVVCVLTMCVCWLLLSFSIERF